MFDSEIDVLEDAFCIISKRESIICVLRENKEYANLLWDTMWNLYDIIEREKKEK